MCLLSPDTEITESVPTFRSHFYDTYEYLRSVKQVISVSNPECANMEFAFPPGEDSDKASSFPLVKVGQLHLNHNFAEVDGALVM